MHRLIIEPEAGWLNTTLDLQKAFGMYVGPPLSHHTVADIVRTTRHPQRIAQPLQGLYTQRTTDVLRQSIGDRWGDLVVSQSFFDRLGDATLPEHTVLKWQCARGDKLGLRALSDPAPYYWLWWHEKLELDLDFSTTRFRFQPNNETRVDVITFADYEAYLDKARDASNRLDNLTVLDFSFTRPELLTLDLFTLPHMAPGVIFVSDRLSQRLQRPKLSGVHFAAAATSTISELTEPGGAL